MSRGLAALPVGIVVLLMSLAAQAQTRTSTGVEVQTQRLQEELQEWEGGARLNDSVGSPFSGPGAPRTETSVPPPAPPPVVRSGVVAVSKKPFNQELYDEGVAQRYQGKILLIGGIAGAVIGSVMGVAGWVKALTRSSSSGNSAAGLLLGGFLVGGGGTACLVVGSVKMHRGGKKMDRAKGLRLTHLGPMSIDGAVRGAAVGFAF